VRCRFINSRGIASWPLSLLLLASVLFLGTVPAAGGGEREPSPEVLRLLEEILASQQETVSLQGRFTQQKSMALFKDPEFSSGRFSYSQPDLMRLDYDTPNRVVLLLNGDNLVTYYPDLGEAERFDVRKQKKRVFDHLIGRDGIGQLKKNFTIVLGAGDTREMSAPDPDVDSQRLHLVPRRRQLRKRIDFIDLWVRSSDHAPVQYFIREKSGDTTLFRLDEVVVNGDLPESCFALDLPDGVVISERSGTDGGKDEE
jgi:outer membrane lipoprotein-sorting protein